MWPAVDRCIRPVNALLSALLYVILMKGTTIVQLVDSTQFSVPYD